jgi:hypothetical protein
MPIIPATQEAETEKFVVQGQPEQKISETHLNQQAGCVVRAYVPTLLEVEVSGLRSKTGS